MTSGETHKQLLEAPLAGARADDRHDWASKVRRRKVAPIPPDLMIREWPACLRGFTALSEATEPTAMIAALDAWFDRVAGAVHAFGGEVLKFIGAGMAHLDAVRQAQGQHRHGRACPAGRGQRANARQVFEAYLNGGPGSGSRRASGLQGRQLPAEHSSRHAANGATYSALWKRWGTITLPFGAVLGKVCGG